jgi:hypothetical protein
MNPQRGRHQRHFSLIHHNLSQLGEQIHTYPGPTAELSFLNRKVVIVSCVKDGWEARCVSVKHLRSTQADPDDDLIRTDSDRFAADLHHRGGVPKRQLSQDVRTQDGFVGSSNS